MRFKDAFHSVSHLVHLFLTKLVNREKFEIVDPFVPESGLVECDVQDWDDYWAEKKSRPSLLAYDLIAAFYRKFIIKKSLNCFVRKHFQKGARVLHAGCGSGQVDRDILGYVSITALDISPAALTFYKKVNQGRCELLHGSIFNIPASASSFEGVYNLGVMEHFTEKEIHRILQEFSRVLKPGAKILLFWPHEYGSSVTVLKFVHYVLNDLLGKGIKLHPDEITRIRSKAQARQLLANNGFELVEYSFGPRDLFTHAILVGKRA
jgi:ubiquinone/menaquinone biosynthesis C-methylase UbiE